VEGATPTDDVVRNADLFPTGVGFRRQLDGEWCDVTWSGFRDDVMAIARCLVASGLASGDRVGLLSETRYEWTLLDYAIWWAGGVVVPVYPTWPAEQIHRVLRECGAAACFVGDVAHLATLDQLRTELPELRHVWRIGETVTEMFGETADEVPADVLERRRRSARPSSPATIVYTPGTTGQPKGCLLSHGNLMHELRVVTQALDDLFGPEDAATVLFLPLAHIDTRMVQLCCVRAGARLGHCSDPHDIPETMVAIRPTFLLATPRVLQAAYTVASSRAHSNRRARLFTAAAETAIRYSRALDAAGPGWLFRARHAAFGRLVYAGLRAAAGGRIRHAICVSGPLDERLAHFWRGIGVPVLEGYGLTESSGALTLNRPSDQRIGTAGRPLDGTHLRIADDGELLVRGPQVLLSYWGSAACALPDDDGWLRTGDLAEIDGDGWLRVTGRQAELLVTAGGKSVAPTVLEDRVRAHPLVSQCLVVGDGKPFIAALITVDHEALRAWATEHNKFARTARLLEDPQLRDAVQSAVDDANTLVSQAESLRAFRLLLDDWTERRGHLTPMQTLKRSALLRDLRDEIRSLYP